MMKRKTRTTRTHKTSALVCAVATLTAVGVSACSGSTQGGASGGAAAGGAATLTIQGDAGNPALVENFNPLQPSTALHGVNLIYESMEIVSPIDGTFTPFLATGNKFTDPKTLVFTIRQGAKWSDGKPFTPGDVVFTFNLLKKFPGLDGNGVWQHLSAISTTGNDVTFTFNAPNVPFASTIAQIPIVPEHLWSSVADPVKFTNTKPIGTGPFTLGTFAPTQYALTKNTSYWQADKIVPAKVLFPAQASNQSTNQLDVSSGKFDWAYNFLPDVKTTYVARDPKHNIYWFPPGGTIGLYLNLTKAPYSDANFRKGVSLSLNRTTIADKAVNGYLGQASMSGLILPNLQKWLDPTLPNQGQVAQSASAATTAFAKAGYTLQGGKLVGKDGKQASMSIVMPNNFSDWVAAATEVTNELKKVGINASTDLPQFAQYSQQIQSGTFNAAMGGFGGTGTPYTDFNNALNSSFAAPTGKLTANNFERFKSPAVDHSLAALASATDESAQKKATNELEQVIYDQTPIVLLYYGGSWGLFSTKSFTGWPSATDPYTLPTNYNNSLLTVLTHLKKS
jgi:peptide/nickel transport system substrate-binding protein